MSCDYLPLWVAESHGALTVTTTASDSTMTLNNMKLSSSGDTVLIPPQLPTYLSEMHNLKRIVGKPTGEDVKAIHAVIRTQNTMAHLPNFHNPDLSMQLSQHLFGAQLAVYRSNYSMNLLPGETNIYTPPALPSHVPGTLHEIIGAPSDEEIKSAQGVVRSLENLANSPHLFDADLSMQLSQHMFNIQFARYMHDSSQGNFITETDSGEPSPEVLQSSQEAPGEHQTSPKVHRNPELGESGNLCRTNKLMTEIRDTLKNMNRVSIASQNSLARGLNSSSWHECGYDLGAHTLVNENGELPEAHNLPSFQQERSYTRSFLPARALTEDALAQYLRFYNMGDEVLEEGQLSKIKPGMIEDAKNLLAQYVGSRWG
ncbi:unnamed protein product [Rhizoctonia solani]|uniref:Uncharacterized protein n=1 Tax=Rhizoctonia solani TaxID=456999 RepID=A0A8H2Y0B0_9AGAM|nr:unnamed protein product [Rhizoctonia solani]